MTTIITKTGSGNSPNKTTYTICNSRAYSQTLFLGCSVKSYNSSLAWGGEASRLTVELVYDDTCYPTLTDADGNQVTRPTGYNEYIKSLLNDSFQKDKNGNSIVPGKVYYVPNNGELQSVYYYDADPGFYGEKIDLMGVPVYFKHDNFEFNGIIQSWTNAGGASGTKSYTVIIESPSNLLNNAQMILGDYSGTIFRRLPKDDYGFPGYARLNTGEIYGGSILQQNIPNIINVYGYLESLGSYGNSGRNEEGIPALNVINGMQALLSSSNPDDSIFKFSPFARIVGRIPTFQSDGSYINGSYSMGIIGGSYDRFGQLRLGYSLDATALLDNNAYNLLQYYRISQNSITVQEFLANICTSIGRDFYISLELNINGSSIIPVITVNTVSTLTQTYDNSISSFIDWAKSQNTDISAYSKGKSYNSNNPVRSMIIGGKQQRLYQVKNTKYSLKQTTLRYNAQYNKFVYIDHSIPSVYRTPDINSTRNPDLDYNLAQTYSGKVELNGNFSNTDQNWQSSNSPRQGNFNQSTLESTYPVNYNGNLLVSDIDSICPYMGTNNFGYIRRVFSGSNGFKFEFTLAEIGLAIGYPNSTSNTILISESEIRAAMVGIDSYVGFLSAVIGDGGSQLLDIWTKVIVPIVGVGSFNAMVQGISQNFNAANNSRSGDSAIPTGANAGYNSNPVLSNILNKLQKFLGDLGNEYYGKQFMVSVPLPRFWIDSRPFYPQITTGYDEYGNAKYLMDGSQKAFFSYEPADFAWEETGNVIDDSLFVGSSSMDLFTQDNGGIEPILGYNNSYQFNYQKAFSRQWWTSNSTSLNNNSFFNFWKFDAFNKSAINYNGGSATNLTNYYEPQLAITYDPEQYIVSMGYSVPDPYGTSNVPANKLYIKSSVDKTVYLYYSESHGQNIAKMIVTASKAITLNPIYEEALNVGVAAVEFLAEGYTGRSAVISSKILSLMPLFDGNTFSSSSQDSTHKQYNNISIAPKAAVPAFAAIPILFNDAVYGPWVSAPGLAADKIFNNNYFTRLENLVGGVKLDINDSLVPWNYGGMRVLDEAALQLVGSDNNYNITIEEGQITTYGLPLLSLGNELKAAAANFNGPIINNIHVQVGEGNPQTTYSFRTFTKKFTLFNKENAEKLSKSSNNTIKITRDFRKNIRDVYNKLANINITTVGENSYTKSKLNSYSPMTVLVGYSYPYISPKATARPGYFSPGSWTGDSVKQVSAVSLQDLRELPQEFSSQYASKAFMSLDGLLSPVSFYPTLNGSTTPYKKYTTQYCPICNGNKTYTANNLSYYCYYCDSSLAGTETNTSAPTSQLPPFILSNQADETIIQNPASLQKLLQNVQSKTINYVNLNPMIMPVGELRNNFAQDSDYNAHHVELVGRSLVPMAGSLSFKENLAINQNGLEYKDQNALDANLDYNSSIFNQNNGIPDYPTLTNYRFLALKGPLVMTGWGFDTEGYPVPNSSGEPKSVDNNGNPLKIKDKYDSTGTFDQSQPGTILGKNQTWNSQKGEWTDSYKENTFAKSWGIRPDTWPVGPIDLRWDAGRKVWTSSSNTYRFVNVQLEDNLLPPFPARGFLHAIDKTTPLANDLRRMVFVKDSDENYCAPRGAKLLCFYNDNTGFYEPINKPIIQAYGLIIDESTVIISNSYAKGYDAITGEPEPPDALTVEYSNPLGFNIVKENQPGFFSFTNNQWTLNSTNSCGN
jgi:hypothetical protein